ncbi:MAG: cell division protein FtsZ [Methylotenera sp.]|nr:cell division protein FtsZ [Methylotenera sp.]
MSNLQISLIVAGALVIIAMLIINWWQERRFHRQVEDSFSPIKNDALLDDALPSEVLPSDAIIVEPDFEEPSSTYSTIDKYPADDFKIDSVLFESARSEPSFSDTNDRYVKLPQSIGGEADLPDEVSIEAAYDDIINTKLERLSTHEPDIVITPKSNTKVDEIKEIFTDVLQPVKPLVAPESHINQKVEAMPDLSLPSMLHGQMDLTAVLYLASTVSLSTLNNTIDILFDGFDKPVFVHVLGVSNRWSLLQDFSPTSELITKVACSMQLADRGGAASRGCLNRFQLSVETLGQAISGQIEWQSTEDALAKANALDAFCIDVDKTIGFHLVHGENGAFTGTKLRGLAEAQGFALGADGRFNYIAQATNADPSQPSFVMFNREDYPFNPEMLRTSVVKAITFQLDIPHVKQCAEAFTQMVQVAKQMEIGLHAVLVDDKNKILGDIQIEKIRQQLKVIQATMLVRGIVPGSDSARRLFS